MYEREKREKLEGALDQMRKQLQQTTDRLHKYQDLAINDVSVQLVRGRIV